MDTTIDNTQPSKAQQEQWRSTCETLFKEHASFGDYCQAHEQLFFGWDEQTQGPCPWWFPTTHEYQHSNLGRWLIDHNTTNYKHLYQYSIDHRAGFLQNVISELKIPFESPFDTILATDTDSTDPQWLPNATLNIALACFQAPDEKTAISFVDHHQSTINITYATLKHESLRIAAAITQAGIEPKTPIGVCMGMTPESVFIYLGIILAGCQVVALADSFACEQIQKRLDIAHCHYVFTARYIHRGNKHYPLYERLLSLNNTQLIVLDNSDTTNTLILRDTDQSFCEFINPVKDHDIEAYLSLIHI